MKISCMIPCYNEAECIKETTRELIQEFKKLKQEYEFILVDHGSTDSTREQLKILKEEYPSVIKIVTLQKNIGYGAIINKGLKEYTQGDIIGWTCADGEVKAEDTVRAVDFLINNPEYVAVKASRTNRNQGYRKIISRGYNSIVNVLFKIKTSDINGWPLFVRSKAYNDLNVQLKNWVINIEILNKLQQSNFKFKDIDCVYQGRKGGRSKVSPFTLFSFMYQVIVYKISIFMQKKEVRI